MEDNKDKNDKGHEDEKDPKEPKDPKDPNVEPLPAEPNPGDVDNPGRGGG